MTAFPEIVSDDQWQDALDQLLVKEKELTRARDALNAERRKLPIRKLQKAYTLQGPNGATSLFDMFEGRRQLIVYHFMYGPNAKAGCEGCSWVRDAMTHPAHLHARDTTLVMVSRAPFTELAKYQARMRWNSPIPWYSSLDSDFNHDFRATSEHGEEHGVSVFIRDQETIYQSYYSGDRGVEYLGTQWSYLDLTPLGRQETWEDSPQGWPQDATYSWSRRHDEYGD